MINLLPFQEKKKMIFEYRLRLGVTIMFATATLAGVSLALLVPSYVLVLKLNLMDRRTDLRSAAIGRQLLLELA